jgi:hypothetical protein
VGVTTDLDPDPRGRRASQVGRHDRRRAAIWTVRRVRLPLVVFITRLVLGFWSPRRRSLDGDDLRQLRECGEKLVLSSFRQAVMD